MAKYRFRLETLQRVRELERDRQRGRLADAYRAEEILEAQQHSLEEQFVALRQRQRSALSSAQFDVDALQTAARFEPVLKAQQVQLEVQQRLLAEEAERRRQAVIEADRDVRILELLDERRQAEHRQQELRDEMKQLDEVAGIARWRQRLEP